MYRCHPQTHKLIELLRGGAVGEVRAVQATFSFHAPFDAGGRLFSNALGGGGILDVGCYPVSMSRLVAGVASGKDFAEPDEVCGAAHLGRTGVDEWAAATMKFPGDLLATLATGVSLEQENVVRIFGSEGSLFIPNPWAPAREGGTARMLLRRNGEAEGREVLVESAAPLYSLEADVVAEAVFAGRQQASPPAMSWDDTLGNMRTLDRWREAVGLVYESEQRSVPR
jgi:predicted dehydrogenase